MSEVTARSWVRSRSVRVGVAIGVLLAIGILAFLLKPQRKPAADGPSRPAAAATATITRMNLASTLKVNGQLGYGSEHSIKAGGEGQVTRMPKFAATLTRGTPVFRIDDQPVVLFYGRTPLFRRLDATGLVGHDIKMVADNLRALGYAIGRQPPVGSSVAQAANNATAGTDPAPDPAPSPSAQALQPSAPAPAPTAAPAPVPRITVRPGDGVLTGALQAAIRRWQRDVGATPTGVLEPGSVVVQAHEIRVSSVSGQLGDSADSPLISVTGTSKVVTASITADEMEAVRAAKKVSITLPDGSKVTGRIKAISRVVATPDGGDAPAATVTVSVQRASAIRDLDSAPVQIDFTAVSRKGVLAVPVGALLALSGGGYAVQVPGGSLRPVTLGLFAQGMVQIEGPGVSEGTTVVTTS